jgi:hypothetical protein
MEGVRFEAPETLQAAVALLAGATGAARILAGGTDVIVQMETDLIEPALLVDIKKIKETRQIASENGGFRVGAAVPGMAIVEHAAFCKAWLGVVDGVKLIGSIQIKGRASMGGNLCNASPAADSVPPLVAADAIARVVGPNGVREVRVEDIPTGPGKTSLAKSEIVVSSCRHARRVWPRRQDAAADRRHRPIARHQGGDRRHPRWARLARHRLGRRDHLPVFSRCPPASPPSSRSSISAPVKPIAAMSKSAAATPEARRQAALRSSRRRARSGCRRA